MSRTILYTEPVQTRDRLFSFHADGRITEYPMHSHMVLGHPVTGSAQVQVPLDSPLVARNHGEMALVHDQWFYRDLGFGSYLSGELLQDESEVRRLKDGDVIRIDRSVPSEDAVSLLYSNTLPSSLLWRVLPLDRVDEIHIGRTPVVGGLAMADQRVSADHASFFRGREGWAITDLGSTNGVYLSGQRLTRSSYLRPMDIVRIVNAYFIFLGDRLLYCNPPPPDAFLQAPESDTHKKAPAPKPAPPKHSAPTPVPLTEDTSGQLVIHIVQRSVFQRFKRKTLLKDIDLTIHPGEMVLILGGSGAGKTTFMNAVMGYEKAQGKILHGDIDIYEEYDQMKYEIGFVPQQDLLRGTDTVYNTLQNAAKMKLPRRVSREAMETRIDQVLTLLGLQPERDNLVVKLSGGQRKRLSIAVEYISDPSLFFLDEPDSGLDGIMARSLMENLRTIADTGKIVMVITHDPDRAAELFDKVIVLAKDTRDGIGKLAFFGSVSDATRFFETDCLEGIVRRINRSDEGGDGMGDYYIDKYKSGGAIHG